MPPPPRRSYATPQETFGITQKPLNEWFDFAASGLPRQGPAFSSELDAADTRNTQRELDSIRLQRELDSEQAAEQFLSQAAGQNPQGLMRMLAENPSIMASKDAPMIRDYVAQRQAATPAPFSNKTLVPVIAKNIPPQYMGEFMRRTEMGENAVDVDDDIRSKLKLDERNVSLRELKSEAAKFGVPFDDLVKADAVDDPELYIASLMGARKTAGGGTMSVPDIAKAIKDNTDDFGEPINARLAAYYEDELERALAPKPQAAQEAPSPVVPQSDFSGVGSAAGTAVAGAALGAPPAADVAPVAPTPTVKPLGATEIADANRAAEREAAKTVRSQELNQAWSAGKDQPIAMADAAEGTRPQRLVSLAQAAIAGKPIEGATKQELELSRKIADYAERAASGEPVKVSVEDGRFGKVDALMTPGKALLVDLGVNPNELIKIPGGGVFGGEKEVPAWELMDLRLKEISQPLIDGRAIQKQAVASEAVKTKAAQFRGQ